MKRKAAVDANRIFLVTIVLSMMWIYLPGINQISDIFVLQILTQLFLILPAVLYVVIKRKHLVTAIGIKRISWSDFLWLIVLALLFNPVVTLLNDISMLFVVNTTGTHMIELMENKPLVISVLVIGVLPAICEEFVYRGVLYQNYRKSSVLKAILLSAFLFGIMHMNLNQFFYAFFLGILFAIVNEAVGSLIPSVFLHFMKNAMSTVGMFIALKTLRGLRADYVAAEQAGNVTKMEEILAYVGDVPIASENWLEEYMSMESYTVQEIIQYDLAPAVICAILAFFVIRLLAKKNHREDHLKRIFRKQKEYVPIDKSEDFKEETKQFGCNEKKQRIVSVALVVGIAICVVNMILYELLIHNVL